MFSSIYKPVYLKGKAMAQCSECAGCESAVPQQPAPVPKPSSNRPGPSRGHPRSTSGHRPLDDEEFHIPVLICRGGVTMVWPHEATRDVLTGKIPYYYADENGCTRYDAKHMFCALRLNRKDRDRYGEYPLVGGHQRFLPKKEKKKRNYYRGSYLYQAYGKFYDVSGFGRLRNC